MKGVGGSFVPNFRQELPLTFSQLQNVLDIAHPRQSDAWEALYSKIPPTKKWKTTSKKLEDDSEINGRRPKKMEDNLKSKWNTTSKKIMEYT